jgi:hypothetical protein
MIHDVRMANASQYLFIVLPNSNKQKFNGEYIFSWESY